jgi:hypothetical protein
MITKISKEIIFKSIDFYSKELNSLISIKSSKGEESEDIKLLREQLTQLNNAKSEIESMETVEMSSSQSSLSYNRSTWNFLDWETKDPKGIQAMMLDNPKKYMQLFEERYNYKLSIQELYNMADNITPTASDHKGWNLRDWEKNDSKGLSLLIKQNPSKYIDLYEKEYGFRPSVDDINKLYN